MYELKFDFLTQIDLVLTFSYLWTIWGACLVITFLIFFVGNQSMPRFLGSVTPVTKIIVPMPIAIDTTVIGRSIRVPMNFKAIRSNVTFNPTKMTCWNTLGIVMRMQQVCVWSIANKQFPTLMSSETMDTTMMTNGNEFTNSIFLFQFSYLTYIFGFDIALKLFWLYLFYLCL